MSWVHEGTRGYAVPKCTQAEEVREGTPPFRGVPPRTCLANFSGKNQFLGENTLLKFRNKGKAGEHEMVSLVADLTGIDVCRKVLHERR